MKSGRHMMLWAGPVEFQTQDILMDLAGVLLLPLVVAVIATFLLSRRKLRGRGRPWKIAGSFVLMLLGAAFVWGFLMTNIEGGIFDQSFWSSAY